MKTDMRNILLATFFLAMAPLICVQAEQDTTVHDKEMKIVSSEDLKYPPFARSFGQRWRYLTREGPRNESTACVNRPNNTGFHVPVCHISTAAGQIDTPVVPPGKDVRDIYQRAAASRFVVVSTVVKSAEVGRRLSQSEKEKTITSAPDGKATIVNLPVLGGPLYAIRIETTVCRQTAFHIAPRQSTYIREEPGQTAYVFVI